jgi:hypothetical protein
MVECASSNGGAECSEFQYGGYFRLSPSSHSSCLAMENIVVGAA